MLVGKDFQTIDTIGGCAHGENFFDLPCHIFGKIWIVEKAASPPIEILERMPKHSGAAEMLAQVIAAGPWRCAN